MFEISIRSVSGFVPPFFTKIKSNDVKVELLPKADEIKSSLYSLDNIIEDSFFFSIKSFKSSAFKFFPNGKTISLYSEPEIILPFLA